jgi:beta-galactosidase
MDLDLLHMRVTAEKKDRIILDGIPMDRYTSTLLAGEKAADEYKRYTAAPGMGTFTFTVAGKDYGQPLVLEAIFDLDQDLPELPRVGIMAEIPAAYNEVSWFGLGPEESYPDRLAGVFLGRYKHSIADLEVPYVVPQENGNRSGVRNFTLLSSDPSKNNITIRADKPINFSVSRYSLENMWNACHTYELKDLSQGPDGRHFLYIDICQRGVGTATCGPDTREEYRIRPGLFKMRLFLFS